MFAPRSGAGSDRHEASSTLGSFGGIQANAPSRVARHLGRPPHAVRQRQRSGGQLRHSRTAPAVAPGHRQRPDRVLKLDTEVEGVDDHRSRSRIVDGHTASAGPEARRADELMIIAANDARGVTTDPLIGAISEGKTPRRRCPSTWNQPINCCDQTSSTRYAIRSRVVLRPTHPR